MASAIDRIWKLHGDGRSVAARARSCVPTSGCAFPDMLGLGAQHVLAMFGATALVPVLTGFPGDDDGFLLRHRDDHLQPDHAQPRAVRHRLELRVHRAGLAAKAHGGMPAALGGILCAASPCSSSA